MRKLSMLVMLLALLAVTVAPTMAQDSGKVKVRVIHNAADAPAVDVFVRGIVVVRNLAYGQVSGILEVDPGTYNVVVAPTGAGLNAAVLGPAQVSFNYDTIVTASGSVADGTLALSTDSSGINPIDSIKAHIRVGHFSADAPAVDVFAKGIVVVRNLAFGQISDWIEVEPGTLNIAVAPTGRGINTAVIGPAPFTLTPLSWTTVAAIGSVGRGTLAPKIIPEDTSPITRGSARVTVCHCAEGVPAVDVLANGSVLIPVLAYPGALGSNDGLFTLEVPAGAYDVRVSVTGSSDVLAEVPGLELAANTSYFVAAAGTRNDLQVIPSSRQLPNTIIEVLNADGRFGTLLAAIDAAGLTETLQTGGPFTLFAPSDGAFGDFLSRFNLSAETVLGNPEALKTVLLNHVISGKVTADMVAGLKSATTLAGNEINIQVGNLGVVIQYDVNVTRTDVEAANGVIHIVNKVILPPSIDF